jgi:hypothetical protein
MYFTTKILVIGICLFVLTVCSRQPEEAKNVTALDVVVSGHLEHKDLDETSGLQASHSAPGHYFLVNDGGNKPDIYVIDESGKHLGRIRISDAKNIDWEDIASAPDEHGGRLVVIGDIGDNETRRKSINLIFVTEPSPGEAGEYAVKTNSVHQLKLRYPDGPKDCESITWDPVDDRFLLLSKRIVPTRIYAIERETALNTNSAILEYLGDMTPFRRPDARDIRALGKRARWSAQPVAIDISPDGREMVIMTYRSLHYFSRDDSQDWFQILTGESIELLGPPSAQEEAVGFSADGKQVLITAEKRHAPIYIYQAVHSESSP